MAVAQSKTSSQTKPIKLLLAVSAGGHLNQMYSLKAFWEKYPHAFATFNILHAQSMLKDEKVHWIYYPTNRHVWNNLRNIWLAFTVLWKNKYTHVISTGAAPGVVFGWAARLLGRKFIYIDSFTRTHGLSLSAVLAWPMANVWLTQWPKLAEKHKRFGLKYQGKVL